jgi:hypothetical protein
LSNDRFIHLNVLLFVEFVNSAVCYFFGFLTSVVFCVGFFFQSRGSFSLIATVLSSNSTIGSSVIVCLVGQSLRTARSIIFGNSNEFLIESNVHLKSVIS